jgi:hypothetical protein
MAWETTHSLTVLNAKGTNSVFKLQQDLGSAPGSVKKLAINKEPEVNFAFSTDFGEGVLSMWVTLNLVNNYDGDLLSEFSTNPETDFRLLIEIDGDELFRGFLDFKWNDEDVQPDTNSMFEFQATFANGFHGSAEKDMSDIQDAIDASSNTLHSYQTSDNLGSLPMCDFWGEFIFQNICGYDTDDLIVSHDWEAENWNGAGAGNPQFRQLFINPYLSSDIETRADYFKAICRAFTMNAGYSWKTGKPIVQDLRKGKSGDYTGDKLTKVSSGYRTLVNSFALDEQTGLKFTYKKTKRRAKEVNSAVTTLNGAETIQYSAASNLTVFTAAEILPVVVYFDTSKSAEATAGGAKNGISVLGVSVLTNSGGFKGHYSTSPTAVHSLYKATAISLASYSKMIFSYDYKGELNDLIDPMLPIKIGDDRYRACKGRLKTVSMVTKLDQATLISEDYTNVHIV